MKRLSILALSALLSATTLAQDNAWQGANTSAGTATDTDIDDSAFWSLGHIPTSSEAATIAFSAKHSVGIYIPATASFAPGSLSFYAGDWNVSQQMHLYLDKTLTLERLKLETYGSSSGGSGWVFENRFYVGTQTTDPITLTLTGNGDALDLTTRNGNWSLLKFGVGNVVLDFTGSDITFSKGQQRLFGNGINGGGTSKDNATLNANSTVRFSTPGARIFLEDQIFHGPSIAPGNCYFQVRSDQVWTADTNAYISLLMHRAADSVSQPRPLVESIDGGRLDNLGQVNILVNHNAVDMSGNAVDAQPLLGGTYGSLYLRGGNTTLRHRSLGLAGDVTLASACVEPVSGSTPATATDYSLIMLTYSGGASHWNLFLNGHTLALTKGLLIQDTAGNCNKLIHAQDSTLTIGGDFVIDSSAAGATNATPYRYFGVRANAGTVLNLGGSYANNCRCLYLTANSSNNSKNLNFSLSTVNLVGGADKTVTFEVGDASTTTGIQRNTFSISNLCVGVSAAKTSHARLVNDFLNENDASAWQEGEDKNDYRVGEKLIVHELSIGPGSTLEVAGQNVEVGSRLSIADGGTLDLATGSVMSGATAVPNFFGLGDQTAAWGTVASRVIDSSNRAYTFSATYDAETNRTIWTGAPAGTCVLIR